MQKNIESKKFDLITGIFLLILIITLGCDYLLYNGQKIYRILLTILTVLVICFLFNKTFIKKSKFTYYCILAFVFSSMYVGNILEIYRVIPFYDKVLHLISGILIGFIGFIIFMNFNKDNINNINKGFLLIFTMSFFIALAGIWEIWEFTTDQLFGFNSQNASLIDTMMDIICGTLGGIISLVPVIFYLKNKKSKFIEFMLRDIC